MPKFGVHAEAEVVIPYWELNIEVEHKNLKHNSIKLVLKTNFKTVFKSRQILQHFRDT